MNANVEYWSEREYCDVRTIGIQTNLNLKCLKKVMNETNESGTFFLFRIFANYIGDIEFTSDTPLISALQSMNKHNDMYIAIS